MEESDARIADLERELQALQTLMDALAKRLAAGENPVRAELNRAIRRHQELMQALRAVRIASGRYEEEPQELYGPPRR